MKRERLGVIFSLILFFSSSCVSSRVLLSPVPSRIESIEGHARLTLFGAEESSRTKFSFLFLLPDQGRIEVSDFLGRTVYQIIIHYEMGYFVVPSKKVYWKSTENDIIEKFLGFGLTLQELINLFCGKWTSFDESKDKGLKWTLERDNKGRVQAGRRGELRFEVVEFIADTFLAKQLIFEHPVSHGHLRFLRLNFNQPLVPRAFNTTFLNEFAQKGWDDIQALLNDAR